MRDNSNRTITGAPRSANAPGQQESSVPADQTPGQARACAIELSFDSESSLVWAHLTPSREAQPVSVASLRAQLEASGFGAYHTPEATLESVVQKANNRQPGDFVVAERRDARPEWQVSDDREAVYLTLHRAWGGRPVTRDYLLEELAQLGVPERCILAIPFEEVLSMGQTEHQIIARAIPPQNGENTRFEALVEGDRDLSPVEDDKGRVDMHQLHDFVVVDPGTPLMRRIPATQGEAGVNVLGEPLEPRPGKELPYGKDCEGTVPDARDPDVLCASIKGHPVTLRQGVRVDPVLKVKNVDLSTGDIDFDGSLEVAGDVTSGFVVSATGDVIVRGMVEKAEVYAGKNLIISGGVMGEDAGQDEQGQLKLRTRLRAGDNLSAKFINLAEASAGGDLEVREYALQSHLSAGRDLMLGQPSGKGSLIGGWARASRALVANVLGSEASVATEVIVGKAPRKRKLLGRLRQEKELCEHNWSKLNEALAALEQQGASAPETKLARIRTTLESQRRRRGRLQALIERVTSRQRAGADCRVQVKRQLYANVSVTIDGVRHTYHQDQGPRHLVRSGAELINRA